MTVIPYRLCLCALVRVCGACTVIRLWFIRHFWLLWFLFIFFRDSWLMFINGDVSTIGKSSLSSRLFTDRSIDAFHFFSCASTFCLSKCLCLLRQPWVNLFKSFDAILEVLVSQKFLLGHIEYVVDVIHFAELFLAVLTLCSLFHRHPIIQIPNVLLIFTDFLAQQRQETLDEVLCINLSVAIDEFAHAIDVLLLEFFDLLFFLPYIITTQIDIDCIELFLPVLFN